VINAASPYDSLAGPLTYHFTDSVHGDYPSQTINLPYGTPSQYTVQFQPPDWVAYGDGTPKTVGLVVTSPSQASGSTTFSFTCKFGIGEAILTTGTCVPNAPENGLSTTDVTVQLLPGSPLSGTVTYTLTGWDQTGASLAGGTFYQPVRGDSQGNLEFHIPWIEPSGNTDSGYITVASPLLSGSGKSNTITIPGC